MGNGALACLVCFCLPRSDYCARLVSCFVLVFAAVHYNGYCFSYGMSKPSEALVPNAMFVLQPTVTRIICREIVEARKRGRWSRQKLCEEVKSLCDAMWNEVNDQGKLKKSVSHSVLQKLLKLCQLYNVKLEEEVDD